MNTYRVPRNKETAHILPRMSKKNRRKRRHKVWPSSKRFHTLHEATNIRARSTSTPDQSSSILLMAKAQYVARRSESPPCPGSVEKLMMHSASESMNQGLQCVPAILSLTCSQKLCQPWSIKPREIIPQNWEAQQSGICRDHVRGIKFRAFFLENIHIGTGLEPSTILSLCDRIGGHALRQRL